MGRDRAGGRDIPTFLAHALDPLVLLPDSRLDTIEQDIHLFACIASLFASCFMLSDKPFSSHLRALLLPPAVADRGLPVEMEVVVTFVDRSRGMLFVHDGANGFYLAANDFVKKAKWLTVGGKLRFKGVSKKGEFLPVVVTDTLEDLGAGVLPDPPRAADDGGNTGP